MAKKSKMCLCLENPMFFGTYLIRFMFAILFIMAGVQKMRMGYTMFAESLVAEGSALAKDMPHFILLGYGYALPALELIAGVLLLICPLSRYGFWLVGLMYLTFTFGQLYNGSGGMVGAEYIPAAVTLAVGYYMNEHACCGKKKK